MKKLILFLAVCLFSYANSQVKASEDQKKLYAKANAVFLPVGVLNAGIEHQLSNKWTMQEEIFISPWKSFAGKYAQVYMGGVEGRYYFKEAFKHWYIGGNIHFARYKFQKYNYWTDEPYQYEPHSPVYVSSNLYQDGYAIMVGATVGYQWQINDNWNLDLFVGGGHSEGFYKGFDKVSGARYDTDPTREYNRSGEWVPYKGGLMISYRLK